MAQNRFAKYAQPQPQLGGVFIPKAGDPYKAKDDGRKDAELGLKRQALELRKQQFNAEQELRKQAADLRGANGPKLSPQAEKKRLNDQAMRSDLSAVEKQIGVVENLYNHHFKGVGPGSLLEYLGTPARKQFDSANELLSSMVKPLIRGPSEGSWTDADQAKLDKLVLGGSKLDADNEQRLSGLHALTDARKIKHGVPEKGWSVKRIK